MSDDPTEDAGTEILTAEEAAAFLRVDVDRLIRAARQGQIPGARIGQAWRFSRRRLLEHVEEFRKPGELRRPSQPIQEPDDD
jgi:excisionase family DNA binding protein